MPQPDSAKPVTASQRASDLDRINALAALLTYIYHNLRAYLVQRSVVSSALIGYFQKQRTIGDSDTARYAREERAELHKFAERIRSLVDEALPMARTAAPLAQYGLGESAGQYLTKVAMTLNEVVGAVGEDLKMLQIAIDVECQGPYEPWMQGEGHPFFEPTITDLLKHDLLPKLYQNALRLGSLAMGSESTESEPVEPRPTPIDQESVAPQRKPEQESRLVTLKYAADHWFHSFTRQALRKAIDDGTVAAKRFGRGKWAFCLVELLEKGDTIYESAKPESE